MQLHIPRPIEKHTVSSTVLLVLLYGINLTNYISTFASQAVIQIVLYLFTTVLFIFLGIKEPLQRHRGDWFWPLLFVYLLMLLCRLSADYLIPWEGMFLYKHPLTVLFFFIFPILIPSVFFSRTQFRFDIKRTFWIISVLLFAALTFSYLAIIGGGVEKTIDQRYDSGVGVFSITYGHLGTSLILITVYLISIYGIKSYRTIMFAAYIFIGFMSIALSGSRGPFIALIACLAFWYIARSKNTWWIIGVILLLIISGGLLKDVLYSVNDMLAENGIHTFERILDTIFSDDGLAQHTSGRDNLYTEGWNLFLDNPIFGKSLFIPGKIYVHNIFIEQFMALGIIGGSIFLIFNIIAICRAFKLIKRVFTFSIIPVLFLQNLIYGSFSITIIALPAYWLFLLLSMNRWNKEIIKGKQYYNGKISVGCNPDLQRSWRT